MKPARFLVPFAIAASLFGAVLLLLIRHGLHADAGIFVYPLDDAYIHLALSRNLAQHGVWGITPYAFSGASSSPAWTLLLTLIARVAGIHLLTPLLVNIVAALLLLLIANLVLAKMLSHAGVAYITAALFVLVALVPLPGLALVGMEHVLHSAAMVSLISIGAWLVSRPAAVKTSLGAGIALCVLAALCGALRYESCFAVIVLAAVLAMRRRFMPALAMAAASTIGPLAYGLYSFHHAGVYLPFSVLMKASGHGSHNELGGILTSDLAPIVLFVAVAFFLRLAQQAFGRQLQSERFWTFGQSFVLLTLGTMLLHAFTGPIGWLMRYEAYLYALGTVALALAIGEGVAAWKEQAASRRVTMRGGPAWLAAALAVALLPIALGLLHRVHHGWSDVASSIHDRYVAHLPQAIFVSQEMPDSTIIANDIGFLAFYAPHVKILDILGLGSLERVKQERSGVPISPQWVAQWGAREGAQLAIIHTDFIGTDRMIPAGWVMVESWCFPHDLVFLNHVETFFAPDAASAAVLRARLAAFHQVAPELVRYRFPQDGVEAPFPARGESTVCPLPPSTLHPPPAN